MQEDTIENYLGRYGISIKPFPSGGYVIDNMDTTLGFVPLPNGHFINKTEDVKQSVASNQAKATPEIGGISQKCNPKDVAGSQKVGMHVIPPSVLMQVALALAEGELKYSGYNWRDIPIRASVYYASTWRHMADWWEGVNIDKASSLPHVIKAIAGLIVLADAMQQGQFIDDRPKPHVNSNWLDATNTLYKQMVERVKEEMAKAQ